MMDAIILTVESVRTRASTSEALITFALPLEQAANVSRFMGMIGQQVGAAFVDVENARQVSPKGDHGNEARALRQSSFFRTPAVWKSIGTDAQFLEWIRHQHCAYCGKQDHVSEIGEGRCEAAHVRRVENGSGTGIKPKYSAIPLCHLHHRMQHNRGEESLGDREWWGEQRIKFVQQWGWESLKEQLGYESWKDVPIEVLRTWAEEHGVSNLLPIAYLEKER